MDNKISTRWQLYKCLGIWKTWNGPKITNKNLVSAGIFWSGHTLIQSYIFSPYYFMSGQQYLLNK